MELSKCADIRASRFKPSLGLLCTWAAVGSGVLLVVAIVVGLVWALFDVLALIFTKIGALVIILCLFFYMLRQLCVAAVFPGSLWPIKRNIQG